MSFSIPATKTDVDPTPVAAVLWDMDGTLCDTEPLWAAARARVAERFRVPWSSQDALAYVGKPLSASGAELYRRGVPLSETEIVQIVVDDVAAAIDEGLTWKPGARELLSELAAAEIPCALVTMAYAKVASEVARRAHPSAFNCIVAGDDVARGKPHPEGYLRAAEQLGVDPGACVAIEDTENGTQAAEAAGTTVIVVPSEQAVSPGGRRVVVGSLKEVSLESIRSAVAS